MLELSNRVWLNQGAGFARKFPLELDSGNKFVVGCLFYLCQGFSIFAGKSFLKRFTVLSLSHWVKLYLTALDSRGISGWSKLCDIFFRLGECAGGYGLVIGCWILWGGGS